MKPHGVVGKIGDTTILLAILFGKMMIIHPLEYSECPIFKQSHMEIYGDIHQNLSPMRPQILVYV